MARFIASLLFSLVLLLSSVTLTKGVPLATDDFHISGNVTELDTPITLTLPNSFESSSVAYLSSQQLPHSSITGLPIFDEPRTLRRVATEPVTAAPELPTESSIANVERDEAHIFSGIIWRCGVHGQSCKEVDVDNDPVSMPLTAAPELPTDSSIANVGRDEAHIFSGIIWRCGVHGQSCKEVDVDDDGPLITSVLETSATSPQTTLTTPTSLASPHVRREPHIFSGHIGWCGVPNMHCKNENGEPESTLMTAPSPPTAATAPATTTSSPQMTTLTTLASPHVRRVPHIFSGHIGWCGVPNMHCKNEDGEHDTIPMTTLGLPIPTPTTLDHVVESDTAAITTTA